MSNLFSNEPLLDIFIYETDQNIEQLEKSVLAGEKESFFTEDKVNEIFRVMHTIKGSSAMMEYDNIAHLSHAMEDLFCFIRDDAPGAMDWALLSDLVLEGVDFIKLELEKIKASKTPDGEPDGLIGRIKAYLELIKEGKPAEEKPAPSAPLAAAKEPDGAAEGLRQYTVSLFFEEGCGMENIRAFAAARDLEDLAYDISCFPPDVFENDQSAEEIRENGFRMNFKSRHSPVDLHNFFSKTAFVRDFELTEQPASAEPSHKSGQEAEAKTLAAGPAERREAEAKNSHQSIISVDVSKLDKLMDLMGEMVIAEAMVTQNPELSELKLNSFYKAARQLKKITGEMQDMVMSIRMVPLSASFNKMRRVVRDMSRKLDKEVELILIGEDTEVDKNIIEHISDPLMHLVRNAVDHGIETPAEREAAGKPPVGRITLEAKNAGSDVLIIVRDDGGGMSRDKLCKKASEQGLITKTEGALSDREVYNLIFRPGFSTNEEVTEFSGRGVGMDVVARNIEAIGGSVSVDSAEGSGTVTTLKIPLTLAIIDGMNIRVGDAKYTLPTTSIRETFQARASDLIEDPEGNEMIMVRGECYPVLRLHDTFSVDTGVTDLTKGIMLMLEDDENCLSLFADELLGQHQVVVKALPPYMKNIKKVEGLAGCTLLGDGSISLILNIGGLIRTLAGDKQTSNI